MIAQIATGNTLRSILTQLDLVLRCKHIWGVYWELMDAIYSCAREKYEEVCSPKFGGGTNILGISSNLNFSAYFEKICAFDLSSNLGCELIVNQRTRAIWRFNICSIFVARIRIPTIS
jgi:hypothetical protein